MALQQIEPEYVDWVNNSQQKNIKLVFEELKTEFLNLNKTILNNKKSDVEVRNIITKLRKQLLYANLLYMERKMKQQIVGSDISTLNIPVIQKIDARSPSVSSYLNTDSVWYETDVLSQQLQQNMKFIDDYENTNILSQQNKSLRLLAWVSILFLPLSLITGYYGMNFGSMGAPSESYGPFSWKKGQLAVLSMFVVSILIVFIFKSVYFKYN